MEKVFYQISDPTQNAPEGDDSWIEQLKQEKIMCDCWNIIKHTAIDVFQSVYSLLVDYQYFAVKKIEKWIY